MRRRPDDQAPDGALREPSSRSCVLGAIAVPLLLFTDGAANDDSTGERVPDTGPITPSEAYDDPQGAYSLACRSRLARSGGCRREDETWQTGTSPSRADDPLTIDNEAGRRARPRPVHATRHRAGPADRRTTSRCGSSASSRCRRSRDRHPGTARRRRLRRTARHRRCRVLRRRRAWRRARAIVATLTTDKDRFDERGPRSSRT